MKTKADTRKAEIKARVFRKATGKWEDLGIIARPKVRLIEELKAVIGYGQK